MRIVHLYDGHEKVYGGRGSVPGVVWNVAAETAAAGHEVTVLERQWDGLAASTEHEDVRFERLDLSTGADEPWTRVPYEAFESPTRALRLVGDRVNFALQALRVLRRREFDVLHVHLPFAANVIATLVPGLRERMVYTAHLGELRLDALTEDEQEDESNQGADERLDVGGGDGTTDERDDDPDSADGLVAPAVVTHFSPDVYLAKRAARTTVLNPDIRSVFESRGVPGSRLEVVPNGVDLDRFGDVPQERVRAVEDAYGLAGRTVVLFVGTVMPRKGVTTLVRAVADLVTERGHGDVELVVGGEDDLDGEYTERVRDLVAEYGVAEHVTLTGFVPEEDLPGLYARADAFAMPSLEEGFGMTVTEAMAAGTPVVASDVGGVPMQVDDGEQGYLVEPGDPTDVADALERLVTTPDGRMGERARERATAFSWQAVGKNFIRVYRSVC